MDEKKYVTWKDHKKDIPSKIIFKEIFPVASHLLYEKLVVSMKERFSFFCHSPPFCLLFK